MNGTLRHDAEKSDTSPSHHLDTTDARRLELVRSKSARSTLEDAFDAEGRIEPPSLDSEESYEKGEREEDEGRADVNVKAHGSPEEPPDGGLAAWMQVLGSFFLFFNCWGTVNTFGVFQTYYETNPLWHETPSAISWIGSIQAFLLMLVGVVTGPLYDKGYFRELIIAGAVLVPLGFMMTSLCTEYWQTLLAQAVCIGIGNACLFVPSVAILPQYFSKRRALANGIAASGSSFGGIIYPIVFRQLYPKIGFGWATRVLGFISLGTVLFSVAVMRVRIQPKQKRALLEIKAFKEPPYTLFCFGMFFGFIGFYGPCYYIQPYAIQTGIVDENLGFYLLPMLNAASVLGRIVPNALADYFGPLNILTPACTISGLLALCWIAIDTKSGIIAFAVLYGFFSGGFVSLPPPALVTLTPDLRTLGTRMGQSFATASIALLIGAPIAGAILKAEGGNWLGFQLWSGLTMLLGGGFLFAARVSKVGWGVRVKA